MKTNVKIEQKMKTRGKCKIVIILNSNFKQIFILIIEHEDIYKIPKKWNILNIYFLN